MSYAYIITVPVAVAAVLIASLAMMLWLRGPRDRPRGLLMLAGGLFALGAAQWPADAGLRSLGSAPNRTGWDRTVAEAMAAWSAREVAGDAMPWVMLPLVVGLVVLFAWAVEPRSQRRLAIVSWVSVAVLSSVLPGLLVMRWIEPVRAQLWAPGDPRWSLGYVEEWAERGAATPPCQTYLSISLDRHTGLDAGEGEALIADRLGSRRHVVERACRERCDAQRRSGSFNPGVMEDLCAAAREDR